MSPKRRVLVSVRALAQLAMSCEAELARDDVKDHWLTYCAHNTMPRESEHDWWLYCAAWLLDRKKRELN